MIEDGCSIISCSECGAINALQLDSAGIKICPEESLECWCCDNILIDSKVDDENEV